MTTNRKYNLRVVKKSRASVEETAQAKLAIDALEFHARTEGAILGLACKFGVSDLTLFNYARKTEIGMPARSGRRKPAVQLSDIQIDTIALRVKAGEKVSLIAEEFGVSSSGIHNRLETRRAKIAQVEVERIYGAKASRVVELPIAQSEGLRPLTKQELMAGPRRITRLSGTYP